MSVWVGLLVAWLLVALVLRVAALRAADAHCRELGEALDPAPAAGDVALLRPLCGPSPRLEAALESLWREAAAVHARVYLGAEREDDPALAVARATAARRPAVDARVRAGPGPAGANRKVANLVQLGGDADAGVLHLSDADVILPSGYLAAILRPFERSEVGLVTGPWRSLPAPALASRLEAALTNGFFLPHTCLAVRLEGLRFALGASIAVRRSALLAAGGFEPLLDAAADDHALARRVRAAGFRLAWIPVPVEHALPDDGWRGALARQLRWARAVRSVRPAGYLGQTLCHGFAPAVALGALGLAAGGPGGWVPLGWWAAHAAALWRRRTRLGLRAGDLARLPLVEALAFAVLVGGLFGRPAPSPAPAVCDDVRRTRGRPACREGSRAGSHWSPAARPGSARPPRGASPPRAPT